MKLVNPDGTLNGKILTGLISLGIALIIQIGGMFGYKFGATNQVIDIINTLLTVLGLLGVVSDTSLVKHEE